MITIWIWLFTPIVSYYEGPVPPGPGEIDDINNWTTCRDNSHHLLWWLIDYESGVFSYTQHWMEVQNITDLSGTNISAAPNAHYHIKFRASHLSNI